MPRADKAAFIQGMLSEHQLRQQREATKPVPDSKEWWRDVAQGLGVELTALRATIAEQAATIARLEGENGQAERDRELVRAACGAVERELWATEKARKQAEAERDALRARVAEAERALLRPLMTTEAKRLRGDVHTALRGAKTDGGTHDTRRP